MRTLILGLVTMFFCLLVFSPAVSAINIFSNTCNPGSIDNHTSVCSEVNRQPDSGGANNDPILVTLKKVIDLLSYIIGAAAVIVIIIAGLQMIIGGDDAQAIADARNMILYAFIGVMVALVAQSIVVFVLNNVA